MSKKSKRNRALKGKQRVRDEDLAPRIAAGLTQGASMKEALEMYPVSTQPAGFEVVRHMSGADKRLERGLPYAPFVASNSTQAVWSDGVTDRLQMDHDKTYTAEGMRLLREGRQCLRCDEPHPNPPFPLACDMCGYAMKDRQIMDIAMEFDGLKHLGPSRPITEYMAEQDARMEKRKFIDKVIEGGQGKIPRDWLRDATLFPHGPPEQLA